ncbi:hypothetical protein GBA52_024054 [Prunus armeniaca]|nr:hypothetical protein GBA52_024054 [Prunus armeniaca]
MMIVIFARKKWRPYLVEQQLYILTNHRITTPMQHKWLHKLIGYNFILLYRPGSQNRTTNALSRKHEMMHLMAVTSPIFNDLQHSKRHA